MSTATLTAIYVGTENVAYLEDRNDTRRWWLRIYTTGPEPIYDRANVTIYRLHNNGRRTLIKEA